MMILAKSNFNMINQEIFHLYKIVFELVKTYFSSLRRNYLLDFVCFPRSSWSICFNHWTLSRRNFYVWWFTGKNKSCFLLWKSWMMEKLHKSNICLYATHFTMRRHFHISTFLYSLTNWLSLHTSLDAFYFGIRNPN